MWLNKRKTKYPIYELNITSLCYIKAISSYKCPFRLAGLNRGTLLLSSFTGAVEKILFEIQVCHTDDYKYTKDETYINGMPDFYLKLQENVPASMSKMVTITPHGSTSEVTFNTFTPGSVIAMRSVWNNIIFTITAHLEIIVYEKYFFKMTFLAKTFI